MIKSEGYKAFKGTMRITPKNNTPAFYVYGEWLYHPASKCWYANGKSYGEDICKVEFDLTDGIEEILSKCRHRLEKQFKKSFNNATRIKLSQILYDVFGGANSIVGGD